MPDSARLGWRGHARRPVVIGVAVLIVVLVAGGATAWAAGGSGTSGYRTTSAVMASLAKRLDVIGTVEPVNDASPAFQVAGQVASVDVTVGQQVTAGQALASLDPTALTQSVESAQSTLDSAQAKLTENEDGETSTSSAAGTTGTTGSTGTAHTTAATSAGRASTAMLLAYTNPTSSSAGSSQISQDQATLVADQHQESVDQQQEAADLAQAESVCATTTSTTSTTTTDPSSCAAALATASADQSQVAKDQQAVATDENTLASALSAEQSSIPTTGSSTTVPSSGTGSSARSQTSGGGETGGSTSSSSSASGGSGGEGGSSSSADADSAQQIASDQAAIDSAEASLIEAQQALNEAQLTSPITGTVASVGVSVGDTVSADSASSDIVIIGTHSFEVTGTLTSAQVTSVKVGNPASVAVDGTTGSVSGTVSQVGPVQSSSSGYSYPVVVLLPTSVSGLYPGSTADVSITTQSATNVLAVPTSAVTTEGTRSYVLELSGGNPVRKVVKVGIVGGIYTQVLSGVKDGSVVVLANLSEPVPSSSTTTNTGGFGGAGGLSGGGGFTSRFSGGTGAAGFG